MGWGGTSKVGVPSASKQPRDRGNSNPELSGTRAIQVEVMPAAPGSLLDG
jgi:hypothetical protein